MLDLVSCAIGIYIDEKKQSSSNGGRSSKKKEGIRLAIKEALGKSKVKTPTGLWRYFKTHHKGEKNALQVDNYYVWFDEDPTDSGKDLLYHDDGGKKSGIAFVTFKKYVMEVKKSLTNHSTQTEEIL